MKQILSSAAILLVAVVVAAGCGGGAPAISDVKSCLKKLDLEVTDAPKDDPKVKEGAIGTTDVAKADTDDFLIALAAVTTSDKAVKDFEKESEDFAKQDLGQKAEKLSVKSGSDGRYVWVVAGVKDSDGFDDALDCVEA